MPDGWYGPWYNPQVTPKKLDDTEKRLLIAREDAGLAEAPATGAGIPHESLKVFNF